MELHELDLKQYLDVKLLRLNKPNFNYLNESLSGNYNSNEVLKSLNELQPNEQLDNKLKEFNISDEYSPSSESMIALNPTFG